MFSAASIKAMIGHAYAGLHSWQLITIGGLPLYNIVMFVSGVLGMGALWNVTCAEREETKLHITARNVIVNNLSLTNEEKLAAHDGKGYAIHLKATARIYAALAIATAALGQIVEP